MNLKKIHDYHIFSHYQTIDPIHARCATVSFCWCQYDRLFVQAKHRLNASTVPGTSIQYGDSSVPSVVLNCTANRTFPFQNLSAIFRCVIDSYSPNNTNTHSNRTHSDSKKQT